MCCMLRRSISLNRGEKESAEYCYDKLAEIPAMLTELSDRTSAPGLMIRDKPMTELPAEYRERLEGLKKRLLL